jgi:hypothetical protein
MTWFVRGFALTSFVLLVVLIGVWPSLGWARGGGQERANADSLAVDGAGPAAACPNGPEGSLLPVWLQSSGGRRPNEEAMIPGDGSPSVPEPEEPGPAMTVGDIPGVGYTSPLVIPAADFSDDGNDPDGFYFDFAGGYINGDGTACLKAPVYLPNGVVVTSVWASLYDNAPGSVMVRMRRVDVSSGTSNVMASLGTESDSTAIQQRSDSSIGDAQIDYPSYAYYLTVCLNYAGHRLYSVRIYYAQP